MKRRMFLTLVAATTAASATMLAAPVAQAADEQIKIGFLVKQPEEPWFQDEWKFAEIAAKEKGFTLVKIGAPSGEKVMSAIDNLAAQKAQGFVICTPDVKLGPGIVAKAKADKPEDDDGRRPPRRRLGQADRIGAAHGHLGVQHRQAGGRGHRRRNQEARLGHEGRRRDRRHLRTVADRPRPHERRRPTRWSPRASRRRTSSCAPQAKTDTENAFNAANIALTKNPQFKHWVAFALNDEGVLGAVRAAEGRGFKADNMIGVGIGGSESALNEFKKPNPTGFFGTVIISPKRHGEETSTLMYDWIKDGKEPPMLTLTSGMLATRDNVAEVREKMGLASAK